MYDADAATTDAPLYWCVGEHATVGGAVHVMHDEHISVTGVPRYAGTGVIPPVDGEEEFSATCAPLLSAGKPVRLSVPPVKIPQRRPVAVENKAPVLEVDPPEPGRFQSTVTPAFSNPVTVWAPASAALMPLASDAGVIPANCAMVYVTVDAPVKVVPDGHAATAAIVAGAAAGGDGLGLGGNGLGGGTGGGKGGGDGGLLSAPAPEGAGGVAANAVPVTLQPAVDWPLDSAASCVALSATG